MPSSVDDSVTQYRDWGIPLGYSLGQCFRALKLCYHISIDGIEAIQTRLRCDLDNARWFAEQVAQTPDWQALAPVPPQTVCIRHQPPGLEGEALDQHTLAWVQAINRAGSAFMSPSIFNGRWMARASIGVESTTGEHVGALWQLIQQQLRQSDT